MTTTEESVAAVPAVEDPLHDGIEQSHDDFEPAHDRAAREALAALGYSRDTNHIDAVEGVDHDVLIVGAGQVGIATAYALRRSGVNRVSVVDAADGPHQGAWRTTARMRTLRTPKTLGGPELGVPQLSFRFWYEGVHGSGTFESVGRIETADWADYLDWFRRITDIDVRYGVRFTGVEQGADGALLVHLSGTDRPSDTDGTITETARKLVLATGVSGTGGPYLPDVVSGLSPAVLSHTSEGIDFAALEGKSVAVLGAAASAFDAAASALEAGAERVDVYTRRAELAVQPESGPRPNPLLQDVFAHLSDGERWRRRLEVLRRGATVPADSVERAAVFENYRLHVDAAWSSATEKNGEVAVVAEDGEQVFDHVIAGTGYQQDPATRPELASIAGLIARWGDVFSPADGDESELLSIAPYLGRGYELVERTRGAAPWLSDIHVFSIGANVSFGLPVGDVPSLPTGIPRLAEALIRDLVLADLERARVLAAEEKSDA